MQEADQRSRVVQICLSLPEVTHEVKGFHDAFQVRKRHFAYYLNNHHGDGIVGIACKVLPGDNARLIEADSQRFYMPAYVGARGWVGLRLDRSQIDWDEVRELLTHSYVLTAPKSLGNAVRDSM